MTSAPAGSVATTTPTLLWSQVPGAARYVRVVNDVTSGTVLKLRVSVTGGTSFTPSAAQHLTVGHRYTWSVQAVSANGLGLSAFSTARAFRVTAS